MILSEFWDAEQMIHNLYSKYLSPVCSTYEITRMELDILLFLANNPQFDTASDLVGRRFPTKSHVSTSIKSLAERGFLSKSHSPTNRKTIHLSLCPPAEPVIADGRAAQDEFFSVLFRDFTEADREQLRGLFRRIAENVAGHEAGSSAGGAS